MVKEFKIGLSEGSKVYPFDRFKPVDVHSSADDIKIKKGENISDLTKRIYELLKYIKLDTLSKSINDSPYRDDVDPDFMKWLVEQIESIDMDLVNSNFKE